MYQQKLSIIPKEYVYGINYPDLDKLVDELNQLLSHAGVNGGIALKPLADGTLENILVVPDPIDDLLKSKLDNVVKKIESVFNYADIQVHTDLENMEVEERFSYLLNAPETLEFVTKFPEKSRSYIIGCLIEYLILFPESVELRSYLSELTEGINLLDGWSDYNFNKFKLEKLFKRILNEVGVDEVDTDDSKEVVFQYVIDKFIKNGYFYHSFNGIFEESIRKNGLDPDIRTWDWEELGKVSKIFKSHGHRMILGWADLNCEKKTSIADSIGNIYRYALASPEWFAQFVAEGSHIPLDNSYDKKAYYKKDYKAARKNVEMLCQRVLNNSEEDKSYVLDFFEKYWNLLVSNDSNLKCAMIKKSALGRNFKSYNSYKEFSEFCTYIKGLKSIVGFLISTFHHDLQIDTKIDPNDLLIIDLPDYDKVFST